MSQSPSNYTINGNLTFTGSVAGTYSVRAQGIAGDLIMQLPNIAPLPGQALVATVVTGNLITCGWENTGGGTINLSQLTQDGATSGQAIVWNGSAWAPATVSAAPGGSTGQIQWNNAGSFDGAANSKISGSGAVVLGSGSNGSPVATTALTVNGDSGANHIQDWFSQNEGFVVANMNFNGVLTTQGAVLRNTINFNTPALEVHGGLSGSPDIAQFFTPIGGSPANTKVVWIDVNGNLNILEGLKDSTGSLGTNGQFLKTTGSATVWANASASPAGSNGEIQYNNSGAFGGSATTIDANGNITMPLSTALTTEGLLNIAGHQLSISAQDASNIAINGANSGQVLVDSGGNVSMTAGTAATVTMAGNSSSSISISGTGGVSILPAVGQNTNVTNFRTAGLFSDSTNTSGQSGQVLTTTGSAAVWSSSATLSSVQAPTATSFNLTTDAGQALDIFTHDSGGPGMYISGGDVNINDGPGNGINLNGGDGPTHATGVLNIGGNASFAIDMHSNANGDSGNAVSIGTSNGSETIHLDGTAKSIATVGYATLDVSAHNLHIISSLDLAGHAAINNPATSVAITYGANYTSTTTPLVVVTADGADPSPLGGVWVTHQGTSGAWTGFTIHVTTTPASSAIFDYHVIG